MARPSNSASSALLRAPLALGLVPPIAFGVACGGRAPGDASNARSDTVLVYVAASLARPMRAVADSFARQTGSTVLLESGGSLEHARKLTELGRVPDLLVLADYEVFPSLLAPAHVTWYALFARNRMIVAYTARSRSGAEITPANWRHVLQRPGVEVGRTDPDRAPAGYRTLFTLSLAELHYEDPGLRERILARSPPRNMRGNAAELASLLEVGELDYIFEYESLARSHGFRYVRLPREIDLGDTALAAHYARVRERVAGRSPRDSVTVTAGPIAYGLSIPRGAPRPESAERFLAFFLRNGRRELRAAHVDLLDLDRLPVHGAGAPAWLTATTAAASPAGRR